MARLGSVEKLTARFQSCLLGNHPSFGHSAHWATVWPWADLFLWHSLPQTHSALGCPVCLRLSSINFRVDNRRSVSAAASLDHVSPGWPNGDFLLQEKSNPVSVSGIFCYLLSNALLVQAPFVVQSLSHVRLFATPWTAAHQASLSLTICQSLLKLMSIESVIPSNHFILCRPLFPRLQSFPALGSFPMSWLFTSGSQSIGASAQNQSFQ